MAIAVIHQVVHLVGVQEQHLRGRADRVRAAVPEEAPKGVTQVIVAVTFGRSAYHWTTTSGVVVDKRRDHAFTCQRRQHDDLLSVSGDPAASCADSGRELHRALGQQQRRSATAPARSGTSFTCSSATRTSRAIGPPCRRISSRCPAQLHRSNGTVANDHHPDLAAGGIISTMTGMVPRIATARP